VFLFITLAFFLQNLRVSFENRFPGKPKLLQIDLCENWFVKQKILANNCEGIDLLPKIQIFQFLKTFPSDGVNL